MDFIKLTFIAGGQVRIRKINIYDYYYADNRITITVNNGDKYYVKETVEEIDKLLGVE